VSDVYLTRIDAGRNMARYYRMTVQPTLFGEWAVVREWGRLGSGGQVRVVPYPSKGEAVELVSAIVRRKSQRGYILGDMNGRLHNSCTLIR
jgi:predicted DNA-binding WGR domain protein